MGIEDLSREAEDQEHAAKIKEKMDFNQIENKMAQSFIEFLRKSEVFQAVEYVADKTRDDHQLAVIGYDARIKLSLQEILIKREPGDNVMLRVRVGGQMASLRSKKVVWDREEQVLSAVSHSIDHYKKNGLKELDALLEKATQMLAYDFIYQER